MGITGDNYVAVASTWRHLLSDRRLLLLILAVYLLLAVGYGVINPLFEAPDEHKHYFTAQTIAETGRLPFYNPDDPDQWTEQEAAQPPLYYLLGSLLIDPAAVAGAREQVWPNLFARIGDASFFDNSNAFVHGSWEAWPWQGYAAAAHRLRLLSTLLGLGTLLCIYGSARVVWPERPERALLATALVAFLPQFAFLHGAVSNDPLIIFLSAAALWQLLSLWSGRFSRGRLLALGVTAGLAMLAKMTGLALFLFICGALVAGELMQLRRANDAKGGQGTTPVRQTGIYLRPVLMVLLYVALPALLIGGWLLWRNWVLYGDITATSQFIDVAGGDRGYSLLDVLNESSGLWLSLFAVFGWFNVRAPAWVYLVWNSLVALSLIEISASYFSQGGECSPGNKRIRVYPFNRRSSAATLSPAVILAAWALLVYVSLVVFMLRTAAAQGRLLFPALVPLALGLAYGLSCLAERISPRLPGDDQAARRLFYGAVTGTALLTSLYCLFWLLPATYSRPPTLRDVSFPATAVRLEADLGQSIELVAAELETDEAGAGDFVWLTLYWRAQHPPAVPADKADTVNYVVELFGRDLALAGKLQSFHGRGLYPASLWSPGEVVVERTAVPLTNTLVMPAQATVFVKLAGGQPVAQIGALKLVPPAWPPLIPDPLAHVGETIELAAVDLPAGTARPGETINVAATWQAVAPPGGDYTVFVHLGEPGRPPLANGDTPPVGGDYPTRYWAAGEVIDDSYRIVLPADLADGRYAISLGLYDPETGERLPLHSDGRRQPHDAYITGWIEIEG